jgi:serine/threonine-protein kinase RIM15
MTDEPVSGLDVRTPRHQRSSEAIKSKREQIEKNRLEVGGPEEGDDEDDELGNAQIRARSPVGKTARTASKLGTEMMRTNSRGSVISMHDERNAEPEYLRKSLEILEERMESLRIPEEADQAAVAAAQPRKLEQHSHPDPEQARPSSRGHITPPVIFPQKPGQIVADIEVEADLTPMPTNTIDFAQQPTPKPQGSPSGQVQHGSGLV